MKRMNKVSEDMYMKIVSPNTHKILRPIPATKDTKSLGLLTMSDSESYNDQLIIVISLNDVALKSNNSAIKYNSK